MGAVPVQVPSFSCSVNPCSGLPATVGRVLFCGGSDVDDDPEITAEVAADAALAVPATLVAAPWTISVKPTSADVTEYVGSVAPVIATQFVEVVHLFH